MNRNLYKILTIGLVISLAFMIAGFTFGMFNNVSRENIFKISEDNIKLDKFISELKNNKEFDPLLLSSVGILIMIAIPVISVFFALTYFLIKKNYRLFVICIGVLLVLILSAIAGFLI
ncbi:MAG: DUF1634 domain-containing protein [Actinobacteria bacterium]|nr:DUF1634 domain-containing protein [Actinomycetota bacterium]MCL5069840.1 DUF1634 domain-containing protein [Actinomycetota bacterium]